jgi:hypothetical protein
MNTVGANAALSMHAVKIVKFAECQLQCQMYVNNVRLFEWIIPIKIF